MYCEMTVSLRDFTFDIETPEKAMPNATTTAPKTSVSAVEASEGVHSNKDPTAAVADRRDDPLAEFYEQAIQDQASAVRNHVMICRRLLSSTLAVARSR